MDSPEDGSTSYCRLEDSEARKLLYGLVSDLVNKQVSFHAFRKEFSHQYMDNLSEEELSDDEWDFFGLTHELLDWTSKKPDSQSRKDGWIDEEEYLHLLTRNWLRFRRGEALLWPSNWSSK